MARKRTAWDTLRKTGPRYTGGANIRELGDRIAELMLKGNYFSAACRAAGISRITAGTWRRLGRMGLGERWQGMIANEDHAYFEAVIGKAEAEMESTIVETWVEAAKENWQAGRDFLSRRFPQRWGNTERRTLEVQGGQQMQLELVWDDGEEESANRTMGQ